MRPSASAAVAFQLPCVPLNELRLALLFDYICLLMLNDVGSFMRQEGRRGGESGGKPAEHSRIPRLRLASH